MKGKRASATARVTHIADKAPRRATSVDKALKLLASFSEERPRLGVSQAARLIGMDKGTASRLLRQLAEDGFLEARAGGGGYQLGWRVGQLGAIWTLTVEPGALIASAVNELSGKTGHTVQFAVYNAPLQRPIVTFGVQGQRRVKVAAALGSVVPLHATSVGKAICMAMSDRELFPVLTTCEWTRYTPSTITDRTEFLYEITEARDRGYAVARNEYFIDQYAVGSPVLGADGRVLGALGALAVRSDMESKSAEARLGRLVASVATSMTEQLFRQGKLDGVLVRDERPDQRS